jgi:CRISPR-associated endonuclease/helicase Cas3
MTELLSHYKPDLFLSEHVNEVKWATDFILSNHTDIVVNKRSETQEIMDALVRCHDLGKGSRAFQKYISNPAHYTGPRESKAHAGLSAAMGLLWAKAQGWKPIHALLLVQVVSGHHSGFQPLDYVKDVRLQPDDDGLLEEQWQTLDFGQMSRATGLNFSGIAGDFSDGGRWLFRRCRVRDQLDELEVFDGICFRVWMQFLFSVLLEADKAFLALRQENSKHYLTWSHAKIEPAMVDRFLSVLPDSPVNKLRQQARTQVLNNMDENQVCCTITLPTGVGKTLIAASWAMITRRRMAKRNKGIPPKIIIVLPYLSIIDQTERIYRKLLGCSLENTSSTEVLMASHSLSERSYELEGDSPGQRHTEFFLDTWRSEIVITTFDQLLLAIFSQKTRHLMRFHQLMDAIIILDEVQALPCQLWDPIDNVLRGLTVEGESRILMMSATQPGMLCGAYELVGHKDDVNSIFRQFKRYRIVLRHKDPLALDAFVTELKSRLEDWTEQGLRILVTLNTRASARTVWDALSNHLEDMDIPVYLISADVTPVDRLIKIGKVKKGQPCIVVSTQTVEAGVDMDMDLVIRDFGPLDSIIQIAGRCNRNNRNGIYGGRVEVVSLKSCKGRDYSDMIYDPILLSVTHEVLDGHNEIGEEDVIDLSRKYFALLSERRNTGENLTKAFARWNEMPDIHSLLRGEARKQVSFLVRCDSKSDLWINKLKETLEIEDRWDRRSALRRLAGPLQKRTVTVYARPNLYPDHYARSIGPFWVLNDGYYSSQRGLDLKLDEEDTVCIF